MEGMKPDLNKPLSKGGGEMEDLELLPEREWLRAKIADVHYKQAEFKGALQWITTMEGEEVLDDNGNKIPRMQFELVFELKDYNLPNNNPRKAWLRLGASLNDKANLPTFLMNTVGSLDKVATPKEVIESLKGMDVLLQLSNRRSKKDPNKVYQNVVYDAVKRTLKEKKKKQSGKKKIRLGMSKEEV